VKYFTYILFFVVVDSDDSNQDDNIFGFKKRSRDYS